MGNKMGNKASQKICFDYLLDHLAFNQAPWLVHRAS